MNNGLIGVQIESMVQEMEKTTIKDAMHVVKQEQASWFILGSLTTFVLMSVLFTLVLWAVKR